MGPLFLKRSRSKSTETLIGEGYELSSVGEVQKIAVPDDDRKGHAWCFGTTRVGKTRIMENMIEQDIRKGYSVVVIDPKGDIELFSKIVQIAFEENRHEELILVTPIFPQVSAILDPLSHYYMPEELVGHIISGVEVGKEKFFYNVAYEISLVIVQSLIMLAEFEDKRPSFNLNDVKNLMSKASLEKLKTEIDAIDSPDARQLSQDMQKIVESPHDYYGKVSSSLRVALMELTSGNIGKIIGKADENRFISKLQRGERVIMVAQLGSLLTRKAAFTVGKVLVSMIQSFVGRTFSTGGKVDPPLCVHMDEAQNLLYFGIDDLFAKAGGATAAYAASHFGEIKTFSPILNVGGGISMREKEEDTLRPSDLLTMRPREFYMLTYSGMFKGRTQDVSELYLDIRFPEAPIED